MSDCVVDASTVVLALIGKGRDAATLRQRLAGSRNHAPHLVDAEVGNVLRRHAHTDLISTNEARAALTASAVLVTHRYAHVGPLSDRAWGMRHNVSFYDALYVALAAQLDAPLLTCDRRLSGAPDLPCEVEIV